MLGSNKITLVENKEIITEERKIGETFNTFFANIVKLTIPTYKDDNFASEAFDTTENPSIGMIIDKYINHTSIIAIKQFRNDEFSFFIQICRKRRYFE